MSEQIAPIAPVFRRWADLYTLAPGQSGGRVPAYWADILARDPLMANVVMVVEVAFGGLAAVKVVRVATEPVSSLSATTGKRYDAEPWLENEPVISQGYSIGEGSSQARSLGLILAAGVVNPMEIIRLGGALAGIGEVYLQTTEEGADHDRRYVLLRGNMEVGSFGGLQESVSLDLVDPKLSSSARFPPWVIGETRFSNAPHETATGERYPLIFNSYTNVEARRLTTATTGAQDFLFAWGKGHTVDTTTGVRVNGVTVASGDATYGWTASEEVDLKGTPYSQIQFTNGATVWEDSDAVHVTVTAPSTETVPDLIQSILERFSPLGPQGLNRELFSTSASRMPIKSGFQVLINASGGGSETDAIKWVESGFLESFPMLSMVWENGAYGPVLTDRRSTPVAEWTVGQGPLYDRESEVEEDSSSVANSFVIRYGYDPLLDVFEGVIEVNEETSDVCRWSARTAYGPRKGEVIESPYITGESLARYVINWMVDHFATPSYLVSYPANPDVIIRHRRGDTILLNDPDPDLLWVRETAVIENIAYRRGSATVTLRVWLGPLALTGPQTRSV